MRKALQIAQVGFIFFMVHFFEVQAQQLGSRTELYTIEDGLSQTGINFLLKDSKGFLWIATQDGLDRFDGNTFQIYRHNPLDSNTICDNYIRHLFEDHVGNIWIATNNGLSCFNPKKGFFTNFIHDPENSNSISGNSLYCVYEDKQGFIWVKTLESLEKYDISKGKFVHYYHYNNIFNYVSSDFYFDILEDKNGKIWVGTKDGLNCFDKNLELFERFSYNAQNPYSISDNRIKSIKQDIYGNLWIGTENGLNKFDKVTKRFTRYYNEKGNPNSLNSNVVNSIYPDNNGKIWISTMSGFSIFDEKSNTFQQYKYVNYRNSKLFLTGISSMFLDSSNLLWIGSYQGLLKIDMKPFKFKLFPSAGNDRFDALDISSIYSDNGNIIWIGTWGDGLIKQNKITGLLQTYNTFTNPEVFTDDNIFVIYPDKAQNLWLGTGNGIILYKQQTGQFLKFSALNKDCSFLENNRVYSFIQDKQGNMWIGTEHGLHKYYIKEKKIENYVQIPDSSGVNVHAAYCFALDSGGFIWIGTDNGLLKFNPETKAYKQYVSNLKYKRKGLASNSIYSLLCTKNNDIWIGTNSGLYYFNTKNENFTLFTEREGLPNNLIYAMLEDNNNDLWLSTNKGLVQYNTKTELFTDFDLADGLQSYEFNFGAACKSTSGELFFGGIKGYNSFFPDSIVVNKVKPNIEITSIELIGKGIKQILPAWQGREIRINSKISMVTISCAVLDYTYPSNNQYMYMLYSDESDGLWVNNGNKSNIQFSNLPAGTYYFKVRGANSDLVWSDKEYELTFIIENPIWRSKLAFLLYAFAIFSLGYIIVQWRTRKLRMTNRELLDKEQAALKIAEQKEELTIKNKNITDSINYAKRIQVAMMPSEKTFKRILPGSFVFHKPKDIVSGDFYWIYERHGKVFVAAVDCTGHGVPGAFMSILGVELFRKITLEQIVEPGKILSRLNEDFSKIFSDIEDISLKDGMDIAFCVVDKNELLLEFAGAFNPLYLIRDNKLIEVKGNRFSVSMEKKQEVMEFVTHKLPLQKGDMFYIFSDGYADQFGGYEGKKFKYRRFRHLLLNIHKLPLEDQKKYLDESMESWKGAHEQVDDILVIGIKADFD